MKSSEADRFEKLLTAPSRYDRLKLIYQWVKTGTIDYKEFDTIVEFIIEDDSFEHGRVAGQRGMDGPDS